MAVFRGTSSSTAGKIAIIDSETGVIIAWATSEEGAERIISAINAGEGS